MRAASMCPNVLARPDVPSPLDSARLCQPAHLYMADPIRLGVAMGVVAACVSWAAASDPAGSPGGFTAAAITGLCTAGLVALLLLAGLWVCCWRRRAPEGEAPVTSEVGRRLLPGQYHQC